MHHTNWSLKIFKKMFQLVLPRLPEKVILTLVFNVMNMHLMRNSSWSVVLVLLLYMMSAKNWVHVKPYR